MTDLHLVGHVCLDLAPGIDAPVSLTPGVLSEIGAPRISVGGAVGNAARAVAALGREAVLSCRVGDDALGRICEATLEQYAPGRVHATRSATAATSYSVIVQPPDRDRSIWHHTGANDEFDATGDLVAAPIVHFGYPTLCPAMTRDAGAPTVDLFRRAKAQGSATSLDLSYCAENSPLRGYDWDGYFRRVLPEVDVFCPSWDDIVSARGLDEAPSRDRVAAVASEFLGMGAGAVLISLGELGSYLAVGDHAALPAAVGGSGEGWGPTSAWVDAAPVTRFVSTNGAGDTFKAAFLLAAIDGLGAVEAARRAATVVARQIQGDPLRADA